MKGIGRFMEKIPLISKIGVIFLTWRRHLQKDLVPHKITLKQQYVLRELSKKDFLYPSQIAEILFCDRPTVTVIIKNMERNKWLKKEKDAENGKQFRIFITAEGHKKFASLQSTSKLSSREDFDPLKCLTNDERNQLDVLLTKVLSHIKAIGEQI